MPPPHSPPSCAAASSLPPEPHYHPLPPYPLIYHSTPSPQLRKVHFTLSCTTKAFICVYIMSPPHSPPSRAAASSLPPEPHYHPPPPPILSSITPLPLLSYVRCTPLSLSCTTKAFICVYIMSPPHSPPSCAAASSLPPEPHYHPLPPPYPLIYHSTLSPVPLKHSFVYILYAASSQPSEPRCRLLTASEPHYHPSPHYPLFYHSTPSPQLRKVHSTLSCTTKVFICVYIICRLHTALRAALPPPHCRLLTAS